MKDIPGVVHDPLGHRPRLGGSQRFLRLVSRHGPVGALRDRPPGADPRFAPATAETEVYRLTFSTFPSSASASPAGASADRAVGDGALQPQAPFPAHPGRRRVDLIGGRSPEYQIVVDPLRLQAANLSLPRSRTRCGKTISLLPPGCTRRTHLYLAVVDGRVRSIAEIENLRGRQRRPSPPRPRFRRGGARGRARLQHGHRRGQEAVLLNICSQPDGSTLDIAKRLRRSCKT